MILNDTMQSICITLIQNDTILSNCTKFAFFFNSCSILTFCISSKFLNFRFSPDEIMGSNCYFANFRFRYSVYFISTLYSLSYFGEKMGLNIVFYSFPFPFSLQGSQGVANGAGTVDRIRTVRILDNKIRFLTLHEFHFREFSILGCFVQSGLQLLPPPQCDKQ